VVGVRGRAILIAVLLALSIVSVTAVAVALTTTPKRVAGSGMVDVSCPAGPCEATVGWKLDSNYDVSACKVTWTPSFDGSATIACIVYDSGGSQLASGSLTGQSVTSGVEATHEVPLSTAVDPKDIYSVEVVIMEE